MIAPPTSKIDFALEARRRGFIPFPLGPDSAEPAFAQGDAMATKTVSLLRDWWKEDPSFNIGISTENLLTLRITERCPPETFKPLAALLLAQKVPSSVRTLRKRPNNGIEICLHFSLPVGATVDARSDVLFTGIDVLSTDDFVVGPGSELDGSVCKFADNNSLSQASPWLMDMCGVELPAESKSMNVVALKKPAPAAPTSPPIKTKLDWALEAAKYIPVHPLRWYVDPGPDASPEEREKAAKAAKTPLLLDWPNLATQDPEQIRKLWKQWPDANIGGATNNLIVVDIDVRNGGDATFAGLQMIETFPDTATTRTQGGGQHLIYVAPDGPVKGGTHKLGPGIDIQARGKYVVMPGSTIEGRMYIRENARPPSFAPPWLVEQLKAAKPKNETAGKRIVEEDETAVEMATTWMLKHAPTAEYGNIDDTTYKVSARLYDFGVSVETATDIMLEWNELKCDPPGDVDRLLVVVESASRNRENAIGSKHQDAPGFEAVEIDESLAPAFAATTPAAPAPVSSTMATMLSPFDSEELEDRPWVIPGFACRTVVTMLAGPGGVAKSTYYLMLAVALASGRSDICGFAIPKRERVWVWNQEDDVKEMRRRIVAIMKAYNVSWADMTDTDGRLMIYMDSGVDKPLMLAKRTDGQSIVPGKQVADVIASIKANRISVMTLDPLVEFHEASENDNVQMRAVLGQVRRIAVEANCAALLSTHTRKPPGASSDGFAGEMDAARGASSQLGVVRIAATIFGMSPKDEKAHRLPPGTTRRDFVRLDIAKNNLAPVLPEPIWFTRESVKVNGRPDGESVGVLRPVTLDKKAPTSTIHLPTILADIIATKMTREKHLKVTDVLASATPAQQALFGDKKNRARRITESFEGSDVSPTDSGYLTKTSAQGKPMTLHLGRTSSLPQQPKAGGRGLENAEDTET